MRMRYPGRRSYANRAVRDLVPSSQTKCDAPRAAEAAQQRPQPLESSPADFVGELVPVARYRKPQLFLVQIARGIRHVVAFLRARFILGRA